MKVEESGDVELATINFMGEPGSLMCKVKVLDVWTNYNVKRSYKAKERVDLSELAPENSKKYATMLDTSAFVLAMDYSRAQFPDPEFFVQSVPSKGVFALGEFEKGNVKLLPLTQSVKPRANSFLFCKVGGNKYDLQRPSDFTCAAWYVRSSAEKGEVNANVITHKIQVSVAMLVAKSNRSMPGNDTTIDVHIPIITNTKNIKRGDEIVLPKIEEEKTSNKRTCEMI